MRETVILKDWISKEYFLFPHLMKPIYFPNDS